MELQYRNVVEMLLEDLLQDDQLDILSTDTEEVISDAVCKTLTQTPPLYVTSQIDYFYSASKEHALERKELIRKKFNIYIKLFRGEQGEREWD